MTKLKNI